MTYDDQVLSNDAEDYYYDYEEEILEIEEGVSVKDCTIDSAKAFLLSLSGADPSKLLAEDLFGLGDIVTSEPMMEPLTLQQDVKTLGIKKETDKLENKSDSNKSKSSKKSDSQKSNAEKAKADKAEMEDANADDMPSQKNTDKIESNEPGEESEMELKDHDDMATKKTTRSRNSKSSKPKKKKRTGSIGALSRTRGKPQRSDSVRSLGAIEKSIARIREPTNPSTAAIKKKSIKKGRQQLGSGSEHSQGAIVHSPEEVDTKPSSHTSFLSTDNIDVPAAPVLNLDSSTRSTRSPKASKSKKKKRTGSTGALSRTRGKPQRSDSVRSLGAIEKSIAKIREPPNPPTAAIKKKSIKKGRQQLGSGSERSQGIIVQPPEEIDAKPSSYTSFLSTDDIDVPAAPVLNLDSSTRSKKSNGKHKGRHKMVPTATKKKEDEEPSQDKSDEEENSKELKPEAIPKIPTKKIKKASQKIPGQSKSPAKSKQDLTKALASTDSTSLEDLQGSSTSSRKNSSSTSRGSGKKSRSSSAPRSSPKGPLRKAAKHIAEKPAEMAAAADDDEVPKKVKKRRKKIASSNARRSTNSEAASTASSNPSMTGVDVISFASGRSSGLGSTTKEVEPKPEVEVEKVEPQPEVEVEKAELKPEEEADKPEGGPKPLTELLTVEAANLEGPDLPTNFVESREPSSDAEVPKPESSTEDILKKAEQEKPKNYDTSRQSPTSIPEKEEPPTLPSTKSPQSSVSDGDSKSVGSLVDSLPSFLTIPKQVIQPPRPPPRIPSINEDAFSVVSDLESPHLSSIKVVTKKEPPQPSWSPAPLPTNSLMMKTNNLSKKDRRKIVRESMMVSTRTNGQIAESEDMPSN